jgi:hypothetical protein
MSRHDSTKIKVVINGQLNEEKIGKAIIEFKKGTTKSAK